MPIDDDFDTTYFQYCRNARGELVPIDNMRRGKKTVPRFDRSITDFPERTAEEEEAKYFRLLEDICRNLNPMERRTWLRILGGASLLEIAKEERVSKPAINDRIRRMARKNAAVELWLCGKKKKNQFE
jgi:hypothetical protein